MIITRLPTTLGRRLQRITLPSPSRIQQRRWAEVHDVRFLATTQAPRNIAEKYREKLSRKAQEKGLRDIDELKAAYADDIKELKKKDNISIPGLDALFADEEPETKTPTPTETHTKPQSQSKTSSSPTAQGTLKPLSEILDLPKARTLPREELLLSWRKQHVGENSMCALVPTATYEGIERMARAHPTFVLPVLRKEGAEIHFLQWVFDAASGTSTVLFTQLAEFKARGEFAQPHTSITHYTDYGDAGATSTITTNTPGLSHTWNQGVVLMTGNVVENRGASRDDAHWLVMLLQCFYGEEGLGGDAAKRQLLADFTKGGGSFTVERLIEEAQNLG